MGICMRIDGAYSKSSFHDLPELLRLDVARIFNFKISSLLTDLLRGEWSFSISPSRILPPFSDGSDVVEVSLLFLVKVSHVYRYGVCEDHILAMQLSAVQ
jgi:hypothetical protein